MLVLVTGGTGFVGSHAVAALVGAGHRVRVMARSPGRVDRALAPLGVSDVETVTGDVTDAASVERALAGCNAVLHAASVFSFDARRAEEMREVNVRSTEIVLDAAHRLGLDPIVFVSSELALLPPSDGAVLTADSPVGQTRLPYCRSKADSELVARRYQGLGVPVVSLVPAALWGPYDPHLGEGATMATNILRNRYPIVMRGGMHIADVRDVAAAVVRVMDPGRGPRSYMVAGEYITLPDLIRTLGELTGRRIRFAIFPRWFLGIFGRGADVVQRRLKARLPWQGEGIWVMNCVARCDDSKTRGELALEPVPLRVTLTDTVRWLADDRHISPAEAGLLAATTR
jgi:nucleoside-diphosphate-sugar epimerase